MISQRKNNASFIIMSSITAICIIVVLSTFALAEEYGTRPKTVLGSPLEQKLPRSLPQQRLFRGIRRRKMGIRKRKQMASAPLSNPSPSSLTEYIIPNSDTMREEKKIEQSNGKLMRRKVMRRKRPLPTATSPLPYQGNRRVSSQHQFAPTYNLSVNTQPKYATLDATNTNDVAVKKLRRKKIPVIISSSKIVTYKPKTTPMMPYVNVSRTEQEAALNRTADEKRFLSLFTIVTFKNDACASTAGSNGTCYSSSDCSKLGGTASGTCASGFGVCCLFTKTCGESTSQNCTYFQNTGYPSTYDNVGSCQLTINKCSTNVCQLRLDFDNFVVQQPESTDHVCQSDQFVVSGGPPIPAICGVNTGLHMYVDMGLASNAPIMLTSVTSGASFSRSFSIKVTQIDCYSLSKANDGCLQYFTGVSGQMRSFNYNDAAGLQLSNTDYTMCVRTERNFCGIQYTACPDSGYPFYKFFIYHTINISDAICS